MKQLITLLKEKAHKLDYRRSIPQDKETKIGFPPLEKLKKLNTRNLKSINKKSKGEEYINKTKSTTKL